MKKKLNFYVALLGSKIILVILKILKKNASYFPGKFALKICPDFLSLIEKPSKIIAVTGTNGKTTVCNMIIDVLEKNGYKTLNNRLGSNIDAGIASSLLSGSNCLGKSKFEIAVFEIDERSSRKIYPYIKPMYILCTNIFRDSIKRNGHTDFIVNIINSSIPSESTLILNSDDLICCSIGEKNQNKIYYGLDRLLNYESTYNNLINDMRICPICNSNLKYEYTYYHHIGKAYCTNCSFKSPDADYLLTDIDEVNNTVKIKVKDIEFEYKLISNNLINIYNMLAAITLLTEFGIPESKIREGFDEFKLVETRYKEEIIKDKSIIMYLSKGQNAVACSRTFDFINKEKGKKTVMLNLDDYFDSKTVENICWIYETDYELLNDDNIEQIIIGGVRAKDHYLRLLLAGVPEEKIYYDYKELDAVKYLNLDSVDRIFILYDVYTVETALKVKEKNKGRNI